jgi:cobalt/nickel transport system permease protein
MINKLPGFLASPQKDSYNPAEKKADNLTFLDLTIRNAAMVMKSIYLQADISSKNNFLFNINPYVKVISLIYIIVINSIVHDPASLVSISIFIFLLYLSAGLNIFQLYKKIIFIAALSGFFILLPATLNLVSPGKVIFNIISFDRSYKFWIYNIPRNIGITMNGCSTASVIFLRILNSITFSLFICFTTPFPQLIKSFKILGVPDTFLMIITLSYKFIYILSRTIEDTYFAIKSRLIGYISNKNLRKLVTERIFFIYKKSHYTYEQTYLAMISRGYEGKIVLLSFKKFNIIDFISLILIISFGIFVLII